MVSLKSKKLRLAGLVASVDGRRIIKDTIEGDPVKAEELGILLAENLLSQGADVILKEIYGWNLDYSGNNLLEN